MNRHLFGVAVQFYSCLFLCHRLPLHPLFEDAHGVDAYAVILVRALTGSVSAVYCGGGGIDVFS